MRRVSKIIVLLILLLTNINLEAQSKYSSGKVLSNSQHINDSVNHISNFDKSNYIIQNTGIALLATGLAFLIDESIRKEVTQNNYKNKIMMNIGHEYGETIYSFSLSGLMYLSQFIINDKAFANTGKVLFESLIVSGALSISLKYIFGRSRPYKNEGNTKFNWFETENINNSLPSGHVITAFTTSTVLSEAIGNNYVSVLLYGLASLTAFQRISSDNHWTSDVILGSAIGIIVGKYFSNLSKQDKKNVGHYNLVPFWNNRNIGVSLNYHF